MSNPLSNASPALVNLFQGSDDATVVSRATVVSISAEGLVVVHSPDVPDRHCEVLLSSFSLAGIAPGDTVLVLEESSGDHLPVVLGRIGRCAQPEAPESLTFNASKSISLRCGASSVDLRADGKVLIKGDDVTVRAKGTKRIRAGSVSIN